MGDYDYFSVLRNGNSLKRKDSSRIGTARSLPYGGVSVGGICSGAGCVQRVSVWGVSVQEEGLC